MKTPNNSEILDSKLAGADQQMIRSIVNGLPEDTLSMAWRSSLNEKLLAEAGTRKPKARFSWFAMPAAGLALTATLAIAVFIRPATSPSQMSGPQVAGHRQSSIEIGLWDTYRQESVSREIVGAGPDPVQETSKPSIVDVASDSYGSEIDSDSL